MKECDTVNTVLLELELSQIRRAAFFRQPNIFIT